MKILHIRNIANVAYNLSLQQKEMGHEVRLFDITENYTSENTDISLNLPMKYSKKIYSPVFKSYQRTFWGSHLKKNLTCSIFTMRAYFPRI